MSLLILSDYPKANNLHAVEGIYNHKAYQWHKHYTSILQKQDKYNKFFIVKYMENGFGVPIVHPASSQNFSSGLGKIGYISKNYSIFN